MMRLSRKMCWTWLRLCWMWKGYISCGRVLPSTIFFAPRWDFCFENKRRSYYSQTKMFCCRALTAQSRTSGFAVSVWDRDYCVAKLLILLPLLKGVCHKKGHELLCGRNRHLILVTTSSMRRNYSVAQLAMTRVISIDIFWWKRAMINTLRFSLEDWKLRATIKRSAMMLLQTRSSQTWSRWQTSCRTTVERERRCWICMPIFWILQKRSSCRLVTTTLCVLRWFLWALKMWFACLWKYAKQIMSPMSFRARGKDIIEERRTPVM